MKSVLSVDVAKCKSMFMLMNSDGEILIDSIEVKHNFEGFEKIRKQVETFDINDLTVFMESTGIYHLPVERYFKDNIPFRIISLTKYCDSIKIKLGDSINS